MKLHIKKGDTIKVLAGEYKGKSGRVLGIQVEKQRATVEGLNMVKKHVKPSAENPEGGIVEKEGTIHVSNLMITGADGTASRISRVMDAEGKSVRKLIKTGEEIK